MKHLLEIPDLDARAFSPVVGRMRLYGGKDSAPAAPDYIGQANAQSAGNLNAARATTAANRINQVTPYGSIKYTQGDGFDESGYNAAMQKYKDMEAALDANPNGGQMRTYLKTIGQSNAMPDRNNFVTNPDKWSSQIDLSDTGQQLLDAYNKTSLGMADLQGGAMDRVKSAYSQPFDMSGLQDMQTNVDPNTGMDAWAKATDLIRQQQNPELDRQQAALDTKLANQGVTQGSEAWGIGQGQFGQQRNAADISAQLAGLQAQNQFYNQALGNAGLKNSSRQQQLSERSVLRSMPLNELNALRSGSQVTNPTFSQPGQQGQTSGPDLLGATNAQYQQQVGAVNANNQSSANTTGAVVGAIGTALSFY